MIVERMATTLPTAPALLANEVRGLLADCRKGIDAVNAHGGPPERMRRAFSRAENTIEAAEQNLSGSDLGFLPFAVLGAVRAGFTIWRAVAALGLGMGLYGGVRLANAAIGAGEDALRGAVKTVGKTTELASSVLIGYGAFLLIGIMATRWGKKKTA